MTNLLKKMIVCLMVALLLASPTFLQLTSAVHAQKQPDAPPTELLRRTLFPKPAKTVLAKGAAQPNLLVVKFHEGTGIRLRDQTLKPDLEGFSDTDRRLLNRVGLKEDSLAQQTEQVNNLFKSFSNIQLERLFTDKEEDLESERSVAQAETGEEYADLNLFVRVLYQDATIQDAEVLLDQLNALPIVELAYAQPIGADAQAVTPNFFASGSQGYLEAAPTGIDARYAWTLPGGRGNGVRLIDVEVGWERSHEDLPGIDPVLGMDVGYFSSDHGTAVLGIVGAAENSIGMTGIAPLTQMGVSGVFRPFFPIYDMVGALNDAASRLNRGDVLLIEQHYPGPRTTSLIDFALGTNQFGAVPIEHSLAEFEAIRRITGRGIIVVEPAGNGQQNLDDPLYSGRFTRPDRSGAIVVGAGMPLARTPESFTNFGSRVDMQAWGSGVATLGGGDLFNPGPNQRKYRSNFGGTSSASPIVAGAVCSIQGIRRAAALPVLGANEMRTLLITTGQRQPGEETGGMSATHIGPLPNLRAALTALGFRTPPSLVIDTTVPVPKNALDVNTLIDIQPGDRVVFTASGDIWSGVSLTFRNDPFGWGMEDPGWHLTMGRDTFPQSRGRLFSLLARLDSDYFAIHRGRPLDRSTSFPTRRLFLRINHNNPAAGDGAFTCRVQVWR